MGVGSFGFSFPLRCGVGNIAGDETALVMLRVLTPLLVGLFVALLVAPTPPGRHAGRAFFFSSLSSRFFSRKAASFCCCSARRCSIVFSPREGRFRSGLTDLFCDSSAVRLARVDLFGILEKQENFNNFCGKKKGVENGESFSE